MAPPPPPPPIGEDVWLEGVDTSMFVLRRALAYEDTATSPVERPEDANGDDGITTTGELTRVGEVLKETDGLTTGNAWVDGVVCSLSSDSKVPTNTAPHNASPIASCVPVLVIDLIILYLSNRRLCAKWLQRYCFFLI